VHDRLLEQLDRAAQLRTIGGHYEGGGVVVAHRDEPARPQHATHLDQRGDGIAQVEQHRIGVDDVEACVLERQIVHRAGVKLGVVEGSLGGRRPRRLDLPVIGVHPRDSTRRNHRDEVERNASHAAADIEHVHAVTQMRQQERHEGARVAATDVAMLHALIDDIALIHPRALSRAGAARPRTGRPRPRALRRPTW
jgi:hypothetical protein